MPELVRLYIRNVLIGFGLSALFTGLLVGLDVANLGRLILRSDMGLVAVSMLVVFNGIVFAGVQFAFAVMRMAQDEDTGPRRGSVVLAEPLPVRVRVRPAA